MLASWRSMMKIAWSVQRQWIRGSGSTPKCHGSGTLLSWSFRLLSFLLLTFLLFHFLLLAVLLLILHALLSPAYKPTTYFCSHSFCSISSCLLSYCLFCVHFLLLTILQLTSAHSPLVRFPFAFCLTAHSACSSFFGSQLLLPSLQLTSAHVPPVDFLLLAVLLIVPALLSPANHSL